MKHVVFVLLLFLLQGICFGQDARIDQGIVALLEFLKEDQEPAETYASLAAKADLIVVATLLDKRKVASDFAIAEEFDRDSIFRFLNTLNVLSVLKGNPNEETTVVTTEWSGNQRIVGLKTNFAVLQTRLLLPALSAVEIDGEITEWGFIDGAEKHTIKPEYLLYLKHSGRDNVYVPVTGQRFGGASVRLLNN